MAFKKKFKRSSRRRRGMRYNPGWWKTITDYAGKFGYSGISSAGSAAFAALKGVQYLKSIVNVERKFLDYNQVNQVIGTSATVYPLTQVAGGDAYNQRDGNSIKAASLLLRITAVLNLPSEQSFVRCILLIDNEQRASNPTSTEVLENPTDYLSPINHINGSRFTVLRDFFLNLRKDMNALISKKYIKLGHHIKYSSTTSTDTKEGNIYLLLISDTSMNAPTIDFDSRLRFIDN